MPSTCEGCEGLVELRFCAVVTFWPPMYIGYSRPNSEATFFSASSMALRFSGFEKSTKGSLVNSERWILASAVATADSSSTGKEQIVLRAPNARQGFGP